MFENIGEKIKTLTKVICILGITGSIVYGIYLMTQGNDYILTGLMIAVLGSLISWISSFFMYGFGALITNTEEIRVSTKRIEHKSDEANEILKSDKSTKKEDKKNQESILEDEKVDVKCPSCNANLSYSKSFIKGKSKIDCPMCKSEIDLKK